MLEESDQSEEYYYDNQWYEYEGRFDIIFGAKIFERSEPLEVVIDILCDGGEDFDYSIGHVDIVRLIIAELIIGFLIINKWGVCFIYGFS